MTQIPMLTFQPNLVVGIKRSSYGNDRLSEIITKLRQDVIQSQKENPFLTSNYP